MYAFMGAVLDGVGAATSAAGVALEPHFATPPLSRSVREFWSCRWNLFISGLLRRSVFEPVCDGRLFADDVDAAPLASRRQRSAQPSNLRRLIGLCASFVVSGVLHEGMLRCASQNTPNTGEWLLYFSLQGPLMIIEPLLRKRPAGGVSTVLAIAVTWVLLYVPAAALFFPPMRARGIEARTVAAVAKFVGGAGAGTEL